METVEGMTNLCFLAVVEAALARAARLQQKEKKKCMLAVIDGHHESVLEWNGPAMPHQLLSETQYTAAHSGLPAESPDEAPSHICARALDRSSVSAEVQQGSRMLAT